MAKPQKCTPGNKPCKGKCIPNDWECREDNDTSKSKGAGSEAKTRSNTLREFAVPALLVGGSVATAAGLTYLVSKNGKDVVPTALNVEEGVPSYAPKILENQEIEGSKTHTSVTRPPDPNDDTKQYKIVRTGSKVSERRLITELVKTDDVDRADSITQRMRNRVDAQAWAREVVKDPDTVILDLETTGLISGEDPYDPEALNKLRGNVPGIFEIGMVDTRNKWQVEQTLNPEKKVSDFVWRLTGKSEDEVKNQPKFSEVYPDLKEKLTGKRVIAFNSRFDLQLIDKLCDKNGLDRIQYKNRDPDGTLKNDADAMHMAALYMGKYPRPRTLKNGELDFEDGLGTLQLPQMPGAKAHSAVSDCYSTLDVLRKMSVGSKIDGLRPSEYKFWELMEERAKER